MSRGYNWRNTLAEFASISGILAGFCVALIVLILGWSVADVSISGQLTFGNLAVLFFGFATSLFIAASEFFLHSKSFDVFDLTAEYREWIENGFPEQDWDGIWKESTRTMRSNEQHGRLCYNSAIFLLFIGLFFAVAPYDVAIALSVSVAGIVLELWQLKSETLAKIEQLKRMIHESSTKQVLGTERKRKPITVVVFLWFVLMGLLYVNVLFGRGKATFLLFSGYTVLASFLLTRFYERKSIIERFGFGRNNVLVLIIIVYSALTTVYALGIANVQSIFLASLFEEIFFRGYMLGTLRTAKSDEWRWELTDLRNIIFVSLLFSLAHVFNYYPSFQLSEMYLNLLSVFTGGIVFGFLYVRFETILWAFSLHMVFNLSTVLEISLFFYLFFALFSIALMIVYLAKNLSTTKRTN